MTPAPRTAKTARRATVLFVAFACSMAGAPSPAQPARGWSLRQPAVDKVVFRGMVSYDSAGVGAGAMLYPAPNAAGLLAAILTHGLITESAKKAQKDKLQADADAVLKPYEHVLETLTHDRLIEAGLATLNAASRPRLVSGEEGVDGDAVIDTAPVFMMPADERALVLDNVVRVVPTGGGEPVSHLVRVISAPMAAEEAASGPSTVWLADGGIRLASVSSGLLAESIAIVQRASERAAATEDAPQRTFRFPLGGIERMERAQLVEERCDRLLLRTLRGHLMSVPVREVRCPSAGS